MVSHVIYFFSYVSQYAGKNLFCQYCYKKFFGAIIGNMQNEEPTVYDLYLYDRQGRYVNHIQNVNQDRFRPLAFKFNAAGYMIKVIAQQDGQIAWSLEQ